MNVSLMTVHELQISVAKSRSESDLDPAFARADEVIE